jgi:hypothetical protein
MGYLAQARAERAMDVNGHEAQRPDAAYAAAAQRATSEGDAAAVDPVCGMTVDPHTTPHRHANRGHT